MFWDTKTKVFKNFDRGCVIRRDGVSLAILHFQITTTQVCLVLGSYRSVSNGQYFNEIELPHEQPLVFYRSMIFVLIAFEAGGDSLKCCTRTCHPMFHGLRRSDARCPQENRIRVGAKCTTQSVQALQIHYIRCHLFLHFVDSAMIIR